MEPQEKGPSHFAQTATRHPAITFGIQQSDRAFHMHVLGKTGTGKTTLLETLLRQDLKAGRGITLIDPHGDLAIRVRDYADGLGRPDITYLDVADPKAMYGYNPLKAVAEPYIPLAVSGLLETFKKRFSDSWGVRMEHVFRNALYAILDTGGGTLPDVLKLITDKDFRRELAKRIRNDVVREFWSNEFPNYSDRYRIDSVAPIQNKLGAFLADPRMRRLVTSPPISLSFRKSMDRGQVLIVNCARGTVGEDSASLLGALLVTSIALAAYSRAQIAEETRRIHYLYVDEFQSVTTRSVVDMISELRKYRLRLVLAHQHLSQLDDGVKDAVLGNAGTLIAFRLGAQDGQLISREFMDVIPCDTLVGLPNYTIAIRMMIDGSPARPFLATTLQVDRIQNLPG